MVEALQWQTAVQALHLGVDVILDWGFWSREERDDYKARAAALGARAEVHYLDATFDELSRRLAGRGSDVPAGEVRVTDEQLRLWSTWFEHRLQMS